MTTFMIRLNTVSDIRDFVNLCGRVEYDIDLKSGRYIVDGKSIMGIFSLDLMSPIELTAHTDDASDPTLKEFDKFRA